MVKKPSYVELEHRVKELEKEVIERKKTEASLREKEDFATSLIDNAPIYFVAIDAQGKTMMMNQLMLKVLGYTANEVVGKDYLSNFVPEGDRDMLASVFSKLTVEKEHTFNENYILSKDNKEFLVEWHGTPVFDTSSKLQYFYGLGIDITERKQVERSFHESKKLLYDVFNSIQDGISVLNTDLTISHVNDVMKKWYEKNLPLEGKKCHICYHNKDEPCDPCPTIRCIKSCQTEQEIVPGLPGSPIEWIELFSYPIKDPHTGRVTSIVEFVRDITNRKKAEMALRESERNYSMLVKESPDAIISLDRKGNLLSFNPAAERLSGFSAEEVIGKHFAKIDILVKKSIPKALKEFALVITGIERPPFELTIIRKDKSHLFMEANPRLIKQKKRKKWIQVTLRDITDRKLAEEEKKKLEAQLQQAQKMESIGTLAGGIAHDFNNILGIIIGNTELALDDIPEQERARVNLEEIRTAAFRAKDVVKQLLGFSRKADLELKPTKLIPVIKDSIKLLRATIPTNIDIRQKINDTSDSILADPTQIQQIIINLFTNASHAMQETGGILWIKIENVIFEEESKAPNSELIPGAYVKLTVSDTGQGISPELKDRIFDPYFTTKEVGKGTGMGLSVVHGIVKNHGGVISFESELGKGTTFFVYFPVTEEEAVIETKTVEELPTGNERILFVDDDKSISYVARYRLERLGYQVETKTNPVEALKLFCANPDQFDLVITDMSMSQMTGDQMIGEILKIRPDMPTILCTGFSEYMNKEKATEIGVTEYIEKPLDKDDFAFRVRQVLDEKRELKTLKPNLKYLQ